MDWITLLRSLQSDFIKRLASGCLLHCETEGQYSELTIISGERLKTLREFCWQMAEKYKRVLPVRDVFISYLKGKLGEEVVKERLADFITEVDYEKRFGGDGKIDFTLTSDPSIGIEVKSRHGSIDRVRWSISSEEVEKNAVVVCILIQEDVSEAQSEYHLFLAGFLPTRMIKLKTGKISFGIDQLLYGGGLFCYLEQLQSSGNQNYFTQQPPIDKYLPKQETPPKLANNHLLKSSFQPHVESYLHSTDEDLNLLYLKLGDECFQKGEYTNAIASYNQVLEINSSDADLYYKRGLAQYQLGNYDAAIADYSQAIQINIHDAKSYNKRGLALYQIGRLEEAINDYTQAIRINPNLAVAYKNRAEARSHIGDNQGAIEDYTQAIKINPDYADAYKNRGIARYLLGTPPVFSQAIKINPQDALAYKNRGNARSDLGDFQGAIEDYTKAIEINPNYIDAYYNRGNARSDLGDFTGAFEDYTQAIQINYNYADAYYNRGNIRLEMADKQGAIEDFQKAADIYRKEGKLEALKDTKERILELEVEESLDILNF
ncbi:tetratricopeptide repeat protein [Desmonostoc muscorum LEGE 12446]|uniref:Tetratricopeptide repeat protein n=1 Tax=Desmonostoc muscorum LEGE 12446 TaxID=1828758 RepID=A0A8J7DI88_DESMC|nr:tetratricopeptide repeat protein [Desmonostoc muscorum]MCF2148664.1 tetratricopeptide repeat protein [Desmonostoc muscorum LEGE 12446]